MPGQPDAWYQRIAAEITAGRMPLPKIAIPDPVPVPPLNPTPKKTKAFKQTQFPSSPPVSPTPPPPAPSLVPASKSPVPLQASQYQLEQAAKSARAKDHQRSLPKKSKTHPPKALITLLRGDYAAADRLFLKAKSLNPGRDEKWVWDKVLWDLERDRM